MYALTSGIAMIVVGIGMLIYHKKKLKEEKESTAFETPYMRNGGIGFLMFGAYYLLKYFCLCKIFQSR